MQDPCDRLLLWVHGGGFAFCSPGTHRLFLSKVATANGIPVFAVDYRKPPEFPYPAPGDDVLLAFQELQRECAEKVFVGGDSAGGNLALGLATALAELESGERPAGLVLLSPWVDLSDTTAESWRAYMETDFIPAAQAEAVAAIYAAGLPLQDMRLSPGLRKRWPRCPPVLLDYGDSEVFRSQIERLAAAMAEDGVQVDSAAGEGMVHGYPLFEFLWGEGPGPFATYHSRLSRFLQK